MLNASDPASYTGPPVLEMSRCHSISIQLLKCTSPPTEDKLLPLLAASSEKQSMIWLSRAMMSKPASKTSSTIIGRGTGHAAAFTALADFAVVERLRHRE